MKRPGDLEGVDNSGRVLASLADVRPGIEALTSLGVRVKYEFKRTPVVTASVDGALAATLRRNPWVDYVEPAVTGHVSAQTTAWGHTRVGFPQAWPLSTGSGVKLLVMDSGIDSSAADLYAPVQWRCTDSLSNDIYDYYFGHGTHVAGIAAALNNTIDVVGGAYGTTLYSANVVHRVFVNNMPFAAVDFLDVACGIEVARNNGIRVVNMSFGGSIPSTPLTDQINGGYNYDNMLFVAAVGNDTASTVDYPASLANTIAVTATNSSNGHSVYAITGSAVDIAAPRDSILSTYLHNGASGCDEITSTTAICSGTSMAAPLVAAAAAVLMARYPSWSNATVKTRLLSTALDLGASGFDNTYGYGLLDVAKAVGMQAAVSGPTIAYTGTNQTWHAAVSGGQTPYSYQWYIDGSSAGTGASANYTPGGSDFWVKLTVTDYLSLVARDSLYVTVSGCPPPQLSC